MSANAIRVRRHRQGLPSSRVARAPARPLATQPQLALTIIITREPIIPRRPALPLPHPLRLMLPRPPLMMRAAHAELLARELERRGDGSDVGLAHLEAARGQVGQRVCLALGEARPGGGDLGVEQAVRTGVWSASVGGASCGVVACVGARRVGGLTQSQPLRARQALGRSARRQACCCQSPQGR